MRVNCDRRSPHGERRLKRFLHHRPHRLASSLPSRGAWIETRGSLNPTLMSYRRSPHGERGLKHRYSQAEVRRWKSLPSRGAWIETSTNYGGLNEIHSRSPHGERGLKLPRLHSLFLSGRVAPLTGSVD